MIRETEPDRYEQSFIELMQTPEGQALAHQCYIDWDITDSCKRFEASEEWQAVMKFLNKYISPGSMVLDLGAGNGISSYALSKMDYDVFAIEPNPSDLVGHGAIVKMRQETQLNIQCVPALGEYLPFESGIFSLVYCRQVLHHAENLNSMLREVSRVLQKRGILVATREHVIDDQISLEAFLKNHPLDEFSVEEWAYKLDEYVTMIRSNGMKIIKTISPWESEINYYPSTEEQRIKQLVDRFTQRFGRTGRYVRYVPFVDWIYRQYLGLKDHTPGRMYTFIARKESG